MRFVDEFRDAAAAQQLAAAIARRVTRPWTIMEICGGQTHSIVKFGLDELLPERITLVHGPGCPVCVTPVELIDAAVALAGRAGVTVCSFGDMLRVPGTGTDLLTARARDLRRAKPRPRGGVLRRRVRDHGAGQRHGRAPGAPPRSEELLAARVARAGAAGH
jgi:hypothetical protein